MLEDIDLSLIKDESARQLIIRLLNLVESLSADLAAAHNEIQRLRDEINRLKGEKPKPDFKPNSPSSPNDLSSESERKIPRKHSKQPKNHKVKVSREQLLEVERASLPEDAAFKGYEDVIVQDVVFQTDNILFHKEKFYSPSEQKTYLASRTQGYAGQFGPGIKSLILNLYFASQVSQPKIVELLESVGVFISEGQVSNLLIKEQSALHEEKDEIIEAGLRSSPWQQSDDTATSIGGRLHHCHVVCNPLYSAYFTLPKKDRLSVIGALSNQRERTYLFNEEALKYLEKFNISRKVMEEVKKLPNGWEMNEEEMERMLGERVSRAGPQHRRWIKDGCAVASYHKQEESPVVKLLVCDDAPQMKAITEEIALCWVTDGRHYKKLVPVVEHHRKLLEEFLKEYWEYYRELLKYQENPTPEERERLEKRFDELFASRTGYEKLDERIEKTREKKEGLLAVLKHPEVPLNNNRAELAVRARVRKRDVSLSAQTEEGVRAWDTGMTLVETAKKLGVSFYHYIKDRITGTKQMKSLGEEIKERAKEMRLGESWHSG